MNPEDIPETLLKTLKRRAKQSTKEEFDLEEEIKDIVENQIAFYNRYKTKSRFRQEFSDMMFKQYLEQNN